MYQIKCKKNGVDVILFRITNNQLITDFQWKFKILLSYYFTHRISLIQAEISIYPIGTSNTSASFYIAKGIESIQNMEGIRYEINSMGTVLESENIDKIYEASKSIMEIVHNLGVQRVEVILKIDSRRDKNKKMEEKIESINKFLKK